MDVFSLTNKYMRMVRREDEEDEEDDVDDEKDEEDEEEEEDDEEDMEGNGCYIYRYTHTSIYIVLYITMKKKN